LHLYLIQSPLQAINAYEARTSIADGTEQHELIVFEQELTENNRLIANTLKKLRWTPLRTFPFCPGTLGKVRFWCQLRRALRRLNHVDRVYLGDFAAGMGLAAMNLFPDAEHYLLDDGTSTINFPAFRYDGLRHEHLPSAKSMPWLGYRPELPEQITFYSIYDVPVVFPDETRRNELSFLRDAIRFDPKGPLFFIGTCLPEAKVISFDQFFVLFRAARKWLGERRIIYFPHRREQKDRKKEIFAELGIEIATSDLPIELEIAYGKYKPSAVATFYSTALDTLALISAGSRGNLFSFHVPEQWIQTQANLAIAVQSYESYRRSAEITVVDAFGSADI
jgi:hypothetical protein